MESFTETEILAALDDHSPESFVMDEGDGYTWVETDCGGCGRWSGWSIYHIIDVMRANRANGS